MLDILFLLAFVITTVVFSIPLLILCSILWKEIMRPQVQYYRYKPHKFVDEKEERRLKRQR